MTTQTLTCFKAYDIRGKLGEELNDDITYRIGRAYAQHLGARRVVVGGDARTTDLLQRLGEHQTVSMGSSLKLCLVAEGKAHFYPRLGPTMEWDTAAAHAVVKEAGGVVRDAVGNDLTYNKEDLHNPEFFVYAASDSRLQAISGATNHE